MSARLSAHDGGVALVTGGSRGIGAAIAQSLRDDGWRVATLSRNARVVGRSSTPTGADFRADVSDAAAVERAFDAIEADLGPVLALVNNAGHGDGLTIRMRPEQWDAVISVNLTGAFNCTRRALRSMLPERQAHRQPVLGGRRAWQPGQANYATAKAGLLGFTRTIAEMARRATCNAVTPGLIETDMTAKVAEGWMAQVPAPVERPDEIAAAVAFLWRRRHTSASTLAVDGALGA
jgi:NAD(P)-dependent dehydrogenase (short-subunit alcohol dehydrogenase family)